MFFPAKAGLAHCISNALHAPDGLFYRPDFPIRHRHVLLLCHPDNLWPPPVFSIVMHRQPLACVYLGVSSQPVLRIVEIHILATVYHFLTGNTTVPVVGVFHISLAVEVTHGQDKS